MKSYENLVALSRSNVSAKVNCHITFHFIKKVSSILTKVLKNRADYLDRSGISCLLLLFSQVYSAFGCDLICFVVNECPPLPIFVL